MHEDDKKDEGQEPAADETPAEDATDEPDTKPDEDEAALPEWARKRLAKANGEAAKYRTSLREAEAKLKDAKTPEEFQAAVADLSKANHALERELVAAKFGLPDKLAARLEGATREELEADAKELKALLPSPVDDVDARDLKGGLSPDSGDSADADPAKLAAQWGRRHRII